MTLRRVLALAFPALLLAFPALAKDWEKTGETSPNSSTVVYFVAVDPNKRFAREVYEAAGRSLCGRTMRANCSVHFWTDKTKAAKDKADPDKLAPAQAQTRIAVYAYVSKTRVQNLKWNCNLNKVAASDCL
ncbi:MAG: hypothetical protein FJX47_06505 [Alphaproteobacteria bacterium]|nr:hypothetical protein [Alphaproteobacteria bacterium]